MITFPLSAWELVLAGVLLQIGMAIGRGLLTLVFDALEGGLTAYQRSYAEARARAVDRARGPRITPPDPPEDEPAPPEPPDEPVHRARHRRVDDDTTAFDISGYRARH